MHVLLLKRGELEQLWENVRAQPLSVSSLHQSKQFLQLGDDLQLLRLSLQQLGRKPKLVQTILERRRRKQRLKERVHEASGSQVAQASCL